MNKLKYLLALLLLIFAGCSGGKSPSSPDVIASADLSSSSNELASSSGDIATSSPSGVSSIAIIPPMSQVTSTSSSSGLVATTSSNSNTVPPISLYKLGRSLAKKLNSIDAMTALPFDIDLDTVNMTTGFQFLMKNTGTSNITGLKFKSSLSYFKVTPDTIVNLSAPTASTGMEQLIKVTVEHGTMASGLGYADVLTGDQYGTITITGKNADGDFSVSYVMHVYAKRMVLYVTQPDTIWSKYYETLGYQTSAMMITKYGAWNGDVKPHVYTDVNTHDCYINYVQDNLLMDSTTNIDFYSERMFLDDVGHPRTDIGTLADILNKERNMYTKLYVTPAKTAPDMNCVVMVVNTIDDTQFIIK